MSDGKIYITISDTRTGEVLKDTNVTIPKEQNKVEKEQTTLKDFATHQFYNLIEREAKQMVNYSLANIGNFTGDYNSQREVNHALSVAGFITNVGMATLAGSKFGIPGMIVSGGIALATQTINFGLQLHSQNVETRKQNYSINQLKQLSGLDGLTNGSRI